MAEFFQHKPPPRTLEADFFFLSPPEGGLDLVTNRQGEADFFTHQYSWNYSQWSAVMIENGAQNVSSEGLLKKTRTEKVSSMVRTQDLHIDDRTPYHLSYQQLLISTKIQNINKICTQDTILLQYSAIYGQVRVLTCCHVKKLRVKIGSFTC